MITKQAFKAVEAKADEIKRLSGIMITRGKILSWLNKVTRIFAYFADSSTYDWTRDNMPQINNFHTVQAGYIVLTIGSGEMQVLPTWIIGLSESQIIDAICRQYPEEKAKQKKLSWWWICYSKYRVDAMSSHKDRFWQARAVNGYELPKNTIHAPNFVNEIKNIMEAKNELPREREAVFALVEAFDSYDKSKVVYYGTLYYQANKWYFMEDQYRKIYDNEKVLAWVYCNDVLPMEKYKDK